MELARDMTRLPKDQFLDLSGDQTVSTNTLLIQFL